jgi:hypothetical protein
VARPAPRRLILDTALEKHDSHAKLARLLEGDSAVAA